MKAEECLQLRSFLSLLVASRTLGIQWSLSVLFLSLSVQVGNVTADKIPQRFCGPPVNLIGIHPLNKSHTHKYLRDKPCVS